MEMKQTKKYHKHVQELRLRFSTPCETEGYGKKIKAVTKQRNSVLK